MKKRVQKIYFKRKLLAILLILSFAVGTLADVGFDTKQKVKASPKNSEEVIYQMEQAGKKKLKKGERLKGAWYRDYDRNGRYECVIITGTDEAGDDEFGSYSNRLWLVYKADGGIVCKVIKKKDVGAEYSEPMDLKDASVFVVDNHALAASPQQIYFVKGNTMKAYPKGFDNIQYTGGNNFTCWKREYDADGSYETGKWLCVGCTSNTHYFYYSKGNVHEYRAKKISESQLRKYKNASSILKKYKKLGRIYSIYLRSNHIIQINYMKRTEATWYRFSNLTLSVSKKSVKVAGGKKAVGQGEIFRSYWGKSAKDFPYGNAKTKRQKALKAYYNFLVRPGRWGSRKNVDFMSVDSEVQLVDISGNGIPMLILYSQAGGMCDGTFRLYTYSNGKVKTLLVGDRSWLEGYYAKKHILKEKEISQFKRISYYKISQAKCSKIAEWQYEYPFENYKAKNTYEWKKKKVSKATYKSSLKKTLAGDKLIKFKTIKLTYKNLDKLYKKNY